jgi:hypothetical protein
MNCCWPIQRIDPPTEGYTMRILTLTLLLAGSLMASDTAFAQAMTQDDLKWVNQCIRDNRGEAGGTPAIVRAYCICMNEKMDDNETRSITQWERANPGARRDCERKAGWK